MKNLRITCFLFLLIMCFSCEKNELHSSNESEELYYKQLLESKIDLKPVSNSLKLSVGNSSNIKASSYEEIYQIIKTLTDSINSIGPRLFVAHQIDMGKKLKSNSSSYQDEEIEFRSMQWGASPFLSANVSMFSSSLSCSTHIIWMADYSRIANDPFAPWEEKIYNIVRAPINSWAYTGLGGLNSVPTSYFSGEVCTEILPGNVQFNGLQYSFMLKAKVILRPNHSGSPQVPPTVYTELIVDLQL